MNPFIVVRRDSTVSYDNLTSIQLVEHVKQTDDARTPPWSLVARSQPSGPQPTDPIMLRRAQTVTLCDFYEEDSARLAYIAASGIFTRLHGQRPDTYPSLLLTELEFEGYHLWMDEIRLSHAVVADTGRQERVIDLDEPGTQPSTAPTIPAVVEADEALHQQGIFDIRSSGVSLHDPDAPAPVPNEEDEWADSLCEDLAAAIAAYDMAQRLANSIEDRGHVDGGEARQLVRTARAVYRAMGTDAVASVAHAYNFNISAALAMISLNPPTAESSSSSASSSSSLSAANSASALMMDVPGMSSSSRAASLGLDLEEEMQRMHDEQVRMRPTPSPGMAIGETPPPGCGTPEDNRLEGHRRRRAQQLEARDAAANGVDPALLVTQRPGGIDPSVLAAADRDEEHPVDQNGNRPTRSGRPRDPDDPSLLMADAGSEYVRSDTFEVGGAAVRPVQEPDTYVDVHGVCRSNRRENWGEVVSHPAIGRPTAGETLDPRAYMDVPRTPRESGWESDGPPRDPAD